MTDRIVRPQTMAFRAKPGELLKHDIAPAARRIESERDDAYLKLVRQCPCLRCGLDPSTEAAHVRYNSGVHNKHQAMSKKPEPKWTLPLCPDCHTRDPDSQHRIGEHEFWYRVGLNPLLVCRRLYAQRGDLVAMRAVIFVAIAERENAVQMRGGVAAKE